MLGEFKVSKKNNKPKELVDLVVHEVSIVDKPANQRPFIIIKNAQGGSKMTEPKKDVNQEEAVAFKLLGIQKSEDLSLVNAIEKIKEETLTLKSLSSENKFKEKTEEILKSLHYLCMSGSDYTVEMYDKQVTEKVGKKVDGLLKLLESASTQKSEEETKAVLEGVYKSFEELFESKEEIPEKIEEVKKEEQPKPQEKTDELGLNDAVDVDKWVVYKSSNDDGKLLLVVDGVQKETNVDDLQATYKKYGELLNSLGVETIEKKENKSMDQLNSSLQEAFKALSLEIKEQFTTLQKSQEERIEEVKKSLEVNTGSKLNPVTAPAEQVNKSDSENKPKSVFDSLFTSN